MKLLNTLCALLVATLILAAPGSASAGEPTEKIKSTINEVIEVLKDPSLKGPENTTARRAKLRESISERFSFQDMARRSLGRHWKERTTQEKKDFTDVFARLIENSYIGKIEGYTDEKVVYTGEVLLKRKAMVKTRIVTTKGTEIPINYKLLKRSDWVVYDISVEGVSLVSNYRSQFNSALSSSSYAELVDTLRKKVEAQQSVASSD